MSTRPKCLTSQKPFKTEINAKKKFFQNKKEYYGQILTLFIFFSSSYKEELIKSKTLIKTKL